MASFIPDLTGEIIDSDRLHILEAVGAGSHGIVYLAVDRHASAASLDGTPVRRAIKVMPKASSKHAFEHQRREIAIHQHLSDVPGVLPLLDVMEDARCFYLEMPYLECDLFQLVTERAAFGADGPAADARIRDVFVQIVDAVHACHRRDVFHRDLKPENIVCSADAREVYVTDFGAATTRTVSAMHGGGTQAYLCPEYFTGEYGARPYYARHADVWSLGVILVNMITGGEAPWERARGDDPAFRRFLADGSSLERTLPVSRGAAQLLQRVFRADPRARPSLAQLRNCVLHLDTLFPTEGEEDGAVAGLQPMFEEDPNVPEEEEDGAGGADEEEDEDKARDTDGDGDEDEDDNASFETVLLDEVDVDAPCLDRTLSSRDRSSPLPGGERARNAAGGRHSKACFHDFDFVTQLTHALRPLEKHKHRNPPRELDAEFEALARLGMWSIARGEKGSGKIC